MSKTITLRRLEPGARPKRDDYRLTIHSAFDSDEGPFYREVSPIPEGYEVCDLEHATKILIGETWCERSGSYFILNDAACPPSTIACLGVLAIRPIPEPEPMSGESQVYPDEQATKYGIAGGFPASLIGKRIRWEVVKDSE